MTLNGKTFARKNRKLFILFLYTYIYIYNCIQKAIYKKRKIGAKKR